MKNSVTKSVKDKPELSGFEAQMQAKLDAAEQWFQHLTRTRKSKLPQKLQLTILSRLHELGDATSLVESVAHLQRYSKGQQNMVYSEMLEAMKAGRPATTALEGWMDQFIVKGLTIAEERGALDVALASAVNFLENQSEGIGPVVKSLLYPGVIAAMAIIVGTVVESNVSETIAQTKINPAELGHSFQVLFFCRDFVSYYIWPLIAIIGGGGFYMYRFLTDTFSVVREKTLDNLPIFREYRMILVTRFLNTFTLLIDQGIPEVEAVAITRGGDTTTYFAKHLMRMEGRIKAGGQRSKALNTGLFDSESASLLEAVGDSRHFNKGLKKVALDSQRRYIKSLAFYAGILKGVFFACGVYVALNVFGAVTGLEALFTQ